MQARGFSGVTLMVLASAAFSAMSACVKALGPAFPFAEAVLVRALLGLPLLLLLARAQRVPLRMHRPALLLLRALLGFVGISSLFFALQRAPLAIVTLLNRLQPLFVAMLAPWLLGERTTRGTALVLLVSLAGTALVLRPASAHFDLPALVALVGAVFSALAHLAVRRLSASDHPLLIVIAFSLVEILGGTAFSLGRFVVPSLPQWGLLIGTGLAGTAGQLLMTHAYVHDEAPRVAAASYSSVVWALAIGYLVWRELPDPLALLGGGLIVAAGLTLVLQGRPARR